MRYSEAQADQNEHMAARFEAAKAYLDRLEDQADAARQRDWALPPTMTLAAYPDFIRPYRARVERMLAYPPPGTPTAGDPTITRIGRDSDGTYSRVTFQLMAEGLDAYGILIEPAAPPRGLAVVIHGGGGTPEFDAGFYSPDQHMGRTFARAGYTVWMPACYDRTTFEDPKWESPGVVHNTLDAKARLAGTTLCAIDAYAIIRTTDILVAKLGIRSVPSRKVISCGVSYGGFRAVEACALSDTFDACISSCFFNDRRKILEASIATRGFGDLFFEKGLHTATDVEFCRLVCPRPLYVEVGSDDPYFPASGAIAAAEPVRALYRQLGIAERFGFEVFKGGHVFNGKGAVAFLDQIGY